MKRRALLPQIRQDTASVATGLTPVGVVRTGSWCYTLPLYLPASGKPGADVLKTRPRGGIQACPPPVLHDSSAVCSKHSPLSA